MVNGFVIKFVRSNFNGNRKILRKYQARGWSRKIEILIKAWRRNSKWKNLTSS
jgi:hypothetical protein